MLDLLCDDHYYKQTSTILACLRLDRGLYNYLTKTYCIPPTFVVNPDEIGIHFILNGGERT